MSGEENSEGACLDKVAIGELVHRYCDSLCQRDLDGWVTTFADDGVWDIGRGEVIGRSALSDAFRTIMSLFAHVIPLAHNGEVHVSGNTAHGRWYHTEYGLTTKGRRR